MRIDRRSVLGIGAGGVLATAASAAEPEGPAAFTFLVLNDLHYQDERCGAWLAKVARQAAALPEKPAFALVAGDLTELGTAAEMAGVRRALDGLGMPVHVVPGNHDYLTQADRTPYDRAFPQGGNRRFEHAGWDFLGLDTTEGQLYEKTTIPQATHRFVEETLPRLDPGRPLVVFTHFPLGRVVPMRPLDAGALLERFRARAPAVIFCGHYHGLTERREGETTCVTNRCCSFSRRNHDGSAQKGYLLCTAGRDGRVARRFVEAPPVEAE